MRVKIVLTTNKETIPFEYKEAIVHMFHNAIGYNNKIHNGLSLYCLSNLMETTISPNKNGIDCKSKLNPNHQESYFYVSAYDNSIIFALINHFEQYPTFFCGMNVSEIHIINFPSYLNDDNPQRFSLGSPVLVKKEDNGTIFFKERSEELNNKITYTMNKKMALVGKNDSNFKMYFDSDYKNFKLRQVVYKTTKLICIECPVIIEGNIDTKQFVWDVGVGNSTGLGFGLLL